MLPSQILLNNLLYDASQLAIPTDHVDEEQVRRPAHWDIALIRRFMFVFGPISSVFDFLTFGVMLWVFHAHATEFRSGWFVESLATQTLVIFAIRARRVPFVHSRPSVPLTVSALATVTVGALLPLSPLAAPLGLAPLPPLFFAALAVMVAGYLVLIELGTRIFYRVGARTAPPVHRFSHPRRFRRRSARFIATHRASPRSDRPVHHRARPETSGSRSGLMGAIPDRSYTVCGTGVPEARGPTTDDSRRRSAACRRPNPASVSIRAAPTKAAIAAYPAMVPMVANA